MGDITKMAGSYHRHIASRVGLAIGSLSLLLLLIECGTRGWLGHLATEEQFRRYAALEQLKERFEADNGTALKYVPHRYIGYVPSPSFRGRWAGVYHNSLGFRSPEMPRAKPAGEYRIVALGGSTTYALFPASSDLDEARELIEKVAAGLKGEDDPLIARALRELQMPDLTTMFYALTYPGYLETKLRELGYTTVRVINAGAEGYTSWESMLNFQLRCLDLDPDMVLVYHAYNDIHARLIWPPTAYRGDNSGQLSHSSGWYAPLPLGLRSAALRILSIRLGRARSPADLVSTFGTVEPTAMFWPYVSQLAEKRYPSGFFKKHSVADLLERNRPVYFRRNLENIVLTARYRGIQAVLITFASITRDGEELLDTADYRRALKEQNETIRAIGRELEVPVVDLARRLPDDPALFTDTIHMTPKGGRAMAAIIAEDLVSRGFIRRSRR